MRKKVLIVGGVAGGASAAARLRRLDESAEIIMFERGEYISFANCGLPYHIGEVIKERERLLVQTPEAMKGRFNIDVRTNSEVAAVNTANKKVKVISKEGGEYEETYDYLVLSPGAKPVKPPIEGIDNSRMFSLRNIPDMDRIKRFVDDEKAESAVVIGGGFIGVEVAENLRERGLKVTLVEAAPHILAPFDSEMVAFAEKELQDHGIGIVLNDGVKAFKEASNKVEVSLSSGLKINADMIILAIGVKPDTEFLKGSGVQLGKKGHIIVNDRLQTNADGVYAVGDAIEVVDFVNGRNTAIPLAGPANKQGRIAADNIAGANRPYNGTQGTSIIKVFDLTGAATGNNERVLKALNIAYKAIYVHSNCHASYYPDAMPVSIKLLFNEEGKVLGAQAFGYKGVDKRIDDIAVLMRMGGTIYDMTELELAYAPPFGSAKDPVNMAAYVAENVLTGKMDVVTPSDIDNRDVQNTLLLDVRDEMEVANGKIEGSLNIPVNQLRDRMSELDKNKEILIYCAVGLRGYIASRILMANGFKVKNLTGGFKSYSMSKFKPDKIQPDDESGEDMKKTEGMNKSNGEADVVLDACGLCCPGPLMQLSASLKDMSEGQVLAVTASDPGFYEDVKAFCNRTNNELLSRNKDKGIITARIKKGNEKAMTSESPSGIASNKDNKTMVVFSGELDKAIASFIIANGAASMGKKVTMFFTFWGLNILRKHDKISVQKGFMDKMFGAMMPRGSKRLKLSNMNMMGMGAKMIRKVMKDKNVSSLEELIQSAIDSGIEIVACQMSMDVMGIKQEELIDGVKIGGVGYYLGEAEDSNVNLFI